MTNTRDKSKRTPARKGKVSSRREKLQQTAERHRQQQAEAMSPLAESVTQRVSWFIDAASNDGHTNVVVFRYTGPIGKRWGQEVYDWCVQHHADLTVKQVLLGKDWIDCHHTEIFGVVIDWAKPGEEQPPCVLLHSQIYY